MMFFGVLIIVAAMDVVSTGTHANRLNVDYVVVLSRISIFVCRVDVRF